MLAIQQVVFYNGLESCLDLVQAKKYLEQQAPRDYDAESCLDLTQTKTYLHQEPPIEEILSLFRTWSDENSKSADYHAFYKQMKGEYPVLKL